MANWQYKIDRAALDAQAEVTEEIIEKMVFRLNDLGMKGWELISLMQGPHHINAVLKMKKAAEGEPAPTKDTEGPINITPPILNKDRAKPGDTLVCKPGAWEHGEALVMVFQWQCDGDDLIGETKASYQVRTRDKETALSCMVTAKGASGAAMATSNDCLIGE